ncbi:MAG: phasin family protein [Azoarcus sp.]|jgi:phasin family protein|nr:phasin family protein [Azoarcus sp.]
MVTKSSQVNEIQKKGLDVAKQLAELSIENSKRVVEIQVATAKAVFEDGVNNAKALSGVKDPQQALELRARYAQETAEKMFAAAREITEVAAQAQAEVGKLVGEQLTFSGSEILLAFQQLFKGLPVADQSVLGALQSTLNNAQSAVEQMTRASTEVFQALTQSSTGKGRK